MPPILEALEKLQGSQPVPRPSVKESSREAAMPAPFRDFEMEGRMGTRDLPRIASRRKKGIVSGVDEQGWTADSIQGMEAAAPSPVVLRPFKAIKRRRVDFVEFVKGFHVRATFRIFVLRIQA